MKPRIFIIDDTISGRALIREALQAFRVEVVGTARTARGALSRMGPLAPDLIILHAGIENVDTDEMIAAIGNQAGGACAVFVHSGNTPGRTKRSGPRGVRTHEIEIADPTPSAAAVERLRASLGPIIKGLTQAPKTADNDGRPRQATSAAAVSRKGRTPRLPVTPFAPVDLKNFRPEVVAIGVSTGGPNALACMLPELPDNFNLPILIVQHMPSAFTRSLSESLDARSAVTVKEAEQGETIERNIAYIAPGGRQMKVGLAPDGARKVIVLTDDPPENNCKPSVDYLFRSVAEHYGGQAIGIIMTGMGSDGTAGLRVMKEAGSVVIAQDETSSVVFGMPREAIERGVVDIIAPLDRIATEMLRIVRK